MKKIFFWGLILLMFSSCDQESTPVNNEIPGEVESLRLKIGLVNKELQDLLNPESSDYLGKSYCDGIEVFVLWKGEILSLRKAFGNVMQGKAIYSEESEGVQPPFRETIEYGSISENTLGYYHILANQNYYSREDSTGYTYIRYPDGKEDEIKVKVKILKGENGTVTFKDKIWINGELIYSLCEEDRNKTYYNPNNYPWLEPELDDKGKQIGQQVEPKYGTDLVVIIK